jgi:hypothetical protein
MMPSCEFTSTTPPEKGKQLSPSLNGTDAIWLTDLQIATGAFMFTADLVRYISEPHLVDFVRIQSYGNSTVSSGVATISTDCKLDLKDKHVIVVRVIPLHVLEQVFWGNFVWNPCESTYSCFVYSWFALVGIPCSTGMIIVSTPKSLFSEAERTWYSIISFWFCCHFPPLYWCGPWDGGRGI